MTTNKRKRAAARTSEKESTSVLLRSVGNSYIITMPRAVVKKMELEKGDVLELSYDSRTVTVQRA